jgi:hypothetical protein
MRHELAFVAILVTVILCGGSGAQDAKDAPLFPVLGPVEGADPERLHVEALEVPMALVVESSHLGTTVRFDDKSAVPLKLEVGHKMVVGCEWTLYYFRGEERVVLRRGVGGSLEGLTNGSHVIQGLQEIVDVQASLQLIAELLIFETDIPSQHMWMPKNGKYRILWRGVVSGVLTKN